jgi:hypothetical protein
VILRKFVAHAGLLAIKYAADLISFASGGDISLGKEVSPEKTLILKEKLVEAYDKAAKDVTTLPDFIELNKILEGNVYLKALHELLENYAAFIFEHSLKECFEYSMRFLKTLKNLKDEIRKNLPRYSSGEKRTFSALENAIISLYNHIWEESKRILNLHDLRGVKLDFPKDIVDGNGQPFIPTWDYGPGKKPALNKTKRRVENGNDILKRLLKENEEEAKGNKK